MDLYSFQLNSLKNNSSKLFKISIAYLVLFILLIIFAIIFVFSGSIFATIIFYLILLAFFGLGITLIIFSITFIAKSNLILFTVREEMPLRAELETLYIKSIISILLIIFVPLIGIGYLIWFSRHSESKFLELMTQTENNY